MKVLYVNSVYKNGSTGKIVYDLRNELISTKNDAVVLYGRGKNSSSYNEFRIAQPWEVYLHAFMARLVGINGCFSPLATRKLIRMIEKSKPDIVHLHNLHGYYINYFRLIRYLKDKSISVVWTLHDELMFTGNCDYAYECDKWRTGCNGCLQKKGYPKSLYFDFCKLMYEMKKRTFCNLDNFCFVTPSVWLKKRVACSMLRKAKVEVINNGIDTDNTFTVKTDSNLRQRLGIDGRKIVLAVTDDVMCPRKGIAYTLQVAEKCKDTKYLFIIVGGILPECTLSNVIFVPLLRDQNELAEYYSAADVLLITSQCDNFPTVCIESLACGTPVVGFDVGGIPETAPETNIGKFVNFNDLQAIYNELNCFIETDREQTRNNCHLYAEKHFSRKHMVQQYVELYQKIKGGGI